MNVFERRGNFHGVKITAHYDNHPVLGIIEDGHFTGYNGQLATLLSHQLNFTYSLVPLESYGVKLNDGSYTGTAKALQNYEIDVALGSFFQNPDRLEVSEGAFSGIFLVPEIIFWKGGPSFIPFWTIFSHEAWVTIGIFICISSVLMLSNSKNLRILNLFKQLFLNINDNIKAILVLDIDFERFVWVSSRIHLFTICISGALLYWNFFGDLTGFFTTSKEAPPISSFNDLAQNSELKLLMVKGNAYSQHIINAAQNDPIAKSVLETRIQWFESTDKMFYEFINSRNSGNVLLFRTTFFLMARLSSK